MRNCTNKMAAVWRISFIFHILDYQHSVLIRKQIMDRLELLKQKKSFSFELICTRLQFMANALLALVMQQSRLDNSQTY